jgi:hypothetical protein
MGKRRHLICSDYAYSTAEVFLRQGSDLVTHGDCGVTVTGDRDQDWWASLRRTQERDNDHLPPPFIEDLNRNHNTGAGLANLRSQRQILRYPHRRAPGSLPRPCHFVANSVKFFLDFGHIRVPVRDLAGTDQRHFALRQSRSQRLRDAESHFPHRHKTIMLESQNASARTACPGAGVGRKWAHGSICGHRVVPGGVSFN